MIFIKANLAFISKTIKLLEKQQVSLVDSVALLENFKNTINAVPGHIGGLIQNKMNVVFEKNKGFQKLIKSQFYVEKMTKTYIDPDIISNVTNTPMLL